jgi:hypothetical protein
MIGFYPMGKRSEATRDRFELKPKSRDPSYKRVYGNYPAKKYSKGTPAIARLSFEFTGQTTKYIDIAAALSAVNRRMYRQGLYYYVNSVEYYDKQQNMVDLHVLPDNWVTRMAHRRAKAVFDKMNDTAMYASGTIVPKYHDFKVYMDDLHRQTGSTPPSLHHDNAYSLAYNNDDWVYSQLVSADNDGDISNPGTASAALNQEADNFYLHMVGEHVGTTDNWESVGVISSYGDTRRQPVTGGEPVTPSELITDPLTNLFDGAEEQTNDILTNLAEDNDNTPYDANVYVGESTGSLVQVARLSTFEGGSGRVSIGAGFCAPCGLIMVDPDNEMTQQNEFRIVVNLAVGTYNGVYAERI